MSSGATTATTASPLDFTVPLFNCGHLVMRIVSRGPEPSSSFMTIRLESRISRNLVRKASISQRSERVSHLYSIPRAGKRPRGNKAASCQVADGRKPTGSSAPDGSRRTARMPNCSCAAPNIVGNRSVTFKCPPCRCPSGILRPRLPSGNTGSAGGWRGLLPIKRLSAPVSLMSSWN